MQIDERQKEAHLSVVAQNVAHSKNNDNQNDAGTFVQSEHLERNLLRRVRQVVSVQTDVRRTVVGQTRGDDDDGQQQQRRATRGGVHVALRPGETRPRRLSPAGPTTSRVDVVRCRRRQRRDSCDRPAYTEGTPGGNAGRRKRFGLPPLPPQHGENRRASRVFLVFRVVETGSCAARRPRPAARRSTTTPPPRTAEYRYAKLVFTCPD